MSKRRLLAHPKIENCSHRKANVLFPGCCRARRASRSAVSCANRSASAATRHCPNNCSRHSAAADRLCVPPGPTFTAQRGGNHRDAVHGIELKLQQSLSRQACPTIWHSPPCPAPDPLAAPAFFRPQQFFGELFLSTVSPAPGELIVWPSLTLTKVPAGISAPRAIRDQSKRRRASSDYVSHVRCPPRLILQQALRLETALSVLSSAFSCVFSIWLRSPFT